MKAFTVKGTFKMGQNSNQPFAKQFAAADDAEARELLYSDLGSRQGVRRNNIQIETVDETKPADVHDVIARHKLGLGHEEV